jgi:hypothetical protein
MNITVKQLFTSMTDEDFLILHEEGQLKSFCDALSLDLQSRNNETNHTYTA